MSLNWYHREQECLQGERRECFGPTHILRAKGPYVWDQDGKQYVDYGSAGGTVIFGYGNDTVNRAVMEAMALGPAHTLPTHYEVLAAEKLKEILPFAERVRFFKTAAEAWGFALGISSVSFRLNRGCDAEIAQIRKDVAWATSQGRPIVFNELATNLRVPKLSAASYLGITPDLVIGGGCIANGFPLAYIAGKRSVVGLACGHLGSPDTLSLAAALATMTMLQTKKHDIDALWRAGERFKERFNALAEWGRVRLEGYPTRLELVGTATGAKDAFCRDAARAGLLFTDTVSLTFAHMAPGVEEQTFGALEGIFKRLRDREAV